MSQQIHNQETVRTEISEIMEYITTEFEGALDYWKTQNNNPENYFNTGLEKFDFETLHSEGSELKQKVDRLVILIGQLEFKNIFATNQEFEGRMEHDFANSFMNPHSDPSVYVDRRDGEHSENEFDRNRLTKSVKDWREFLTQVYTNGNLRSNKSGSSHLHVSVKTDAMYSTLTNKAFFDTLCNFLYVFGKMYKTTNAEFYNRLCGNGEHDNGSYWCFSQYDESAVRAGIRQANKIGGRSAEDGHPLRYRYVNYPYALHGTVEIRGLPHFKSEKLCTDMDCAIFAFIETWVDKVQKETKMPKVRLHSAPTKQRTDRSFSTETTEMII